MTIQKSQLGFGYPSGCCPSISEIDLNPVLVSENRAIVADAKVVLK